MTTESPLTADQPPPKLRWFQYRLRSLFVLTTLVFCASRGTIAAGEGSEIG
jgi:hypothetical protein